VDLIWLNRMRKVSYIAGNFQLLVILVIYCVLFFLKNELLLFSLFCYSLYLGFKVLKSRSEYILFNDSLLLLLIFLFLYGFFNPIVSFFFESEISQETYCATIIYASTIPAYILGTCFFPSYKYDLKYLSTLGSKKFDCNYTFFLLVILSGCLLYISYNFYLQGVLFNPSLAYTSDRVELMSSVSQLQVIIGLFVSSIFLYFVYYYKAMPNKFRLVFIFLLIYYVLMQISVGNRRDFVPIMLGFFWVIVNYKKIQFTLGRFVVLLVGLFFFLFLGTLRSPELLRDGFDVYELAILTLSNNEFIYPFLTLKYAVADFFKGSLLLYYGATLLFYPLLFFIPRVIFPLKPISLANKFVLDNFGGGMGYAYSPVTEFFVNFGIFGPTICFLLFGMLISKIQGYKDQRIIFVFFSMIPDFCRGEISSFAYQFFFVALFIISMPVLLKYKLENLKETAS
jgi:oligosaccharide repeat unit polymerase